MKNRLGLLCIVAVAFCVWMYPAATHSSDYVLMGMHWTQSTIPDATADSGDTATPRSLAFDSSGNPGIAFLQTSGANQALMYDYYNGSSWEETIVMLETGSQCGK
ncbi:MAG: hypothetical protein V1754_03770, partial [Pseudomonadota bacterium]